MAKVGEEDFRIFWTGNPGLDNIKNTKRLSLEEIGGHLGIKITDGKFLVFIKHPLSRSRRTRRFRSTKACGPWNNFVGKPIIRSSARIRTRTRAPTVYSMLSRAIGSIPACIFSKRCARNIYQPDAIRKGIGRQFEYGHPRGAVLRVTGG